MRPIRTTTALVLSRIWFDRKRHLAAVAAVAVLMASFLTFHALAAGMHEGLQETLADGKHHQIQMTLAGFTGAGAIDEATFADLAAYPGVVEASPRSVKSVGLVQEGQTGGPMRGPTGNTTFEILLVGIDTGVEEGLVVPGIPGAQTPSPFTRGGYQGKEYALLQGRWIHGPTEAVVTQNAAQAGYGIGATVPTPTGTYMVVGIVQSVPPFTVPGVIPSGHILVDRDTQTWSGISGAYFEMEPDFTVIQSFAEHLIAQYPGTTGALRADMAELERQHFEEARTQQVLTAAGRLVAVAGAATVFAVSLFLLIGERKAIGTMAAVGFTRGRLASYMNQKMVFVAVLGALAGGVLGAFAVAAVPVPATSLDFTPTIDGAVFWLAATQTLVAALAGSLLAFLMTIRKDPIEAIRVAE